MAKFTPASKQLMRLPTQVLAAGCVLVVACKNNSSASLDETVSKVHEAASMILPDYKNAITVSKLVETANKIADQEKENEDSCHQRSTAAILGALLDTVRNAAPTAMKNVNDALCFRLLEILCMAQNGSRCGELLRLGGVLVASAVIGAAFCISAPANREETASNEVRSVLKRLSGYPEDVILAQTRSCLQCVFASSPLSPSAA